MSRRSDAYLAEVLQRPYDILREALIVFGVIAALAIILAAFCGSPDYPPVRGEDVAKLQPVAYLKTCATILAGKASLQDYGPPYTSDRDKAQKLLGMAPANLLGRTIPLDAQQDLMLKPLQRVAVLRPDVAKSLAAYQTAEDKQRDGWASDYLDALDKAEVVKGEVRVPRGDYGPVPVLMEGMLALGRAGLLEGALESGPRLPFPLDLTRSLLFFQEDVDSDVADKLDMTGGKQWGIVHETGNYPGPWWLGPFALWYALPKLSDSPNIDLVAGALTTLLFLILLFLPFIPVLNRVPRWIPVYRVIWRDWYRKN